MKKQKDKSKQKKQKRGERLQRKDRLTDDQRSWIKRWGSLKDYATPDERQRMEREERARHRKESRELIVESIEPPSAMPLYELRKRSADPNAEPIVPGVYWDRGYLALLYAERGGKSSYFYCNDGNPRSTRTSAFLSAHSYAEDISPVGLALSLIGRVIEGNFHSTIDIYRRLINMALSKEELMKLSERNFAVAYSRIMKLEKPIQRMKPTEEAVEKLCAKLAEEGEVLNEKAALEQGEQGATETEAGAEDSENGESAEGGDASSAPEQEKTDAPPPTDKSKGIGMSATKSKGKKKLSGAAAAKKKGAAETAKKVIAPSNKENPFREGSMKAKCFDIFKKGGERGKIIEAIKKAGAKEATANSWYGLFTKV